MIKPLLSLLGKHTLSFFKNLGNFILFLCESFLHLRSLQLKALLEQLVEMALKSLPLIAITALFTGAVLALQSYTGFSRLHAESSIASIVVISLTRELAPVLSGLIFAGRLSASIAAELGTMKVSEQIAAMEVLGVNSRSYLIVPRLLAGLISLPLLVLFADILGLFGGYLVAVNQLGFEANLYLKKTFEHLVYHDVLSGLIKGLVFGFTICSIGCYLGYQTRGGAQAVGRATTKSVVLSSFALLFLNYLITGLVFTKN